MELPVQIPQAKCCIYSTFQAHLSKLTKIKRTLLKCMHLSVKYWNIFKKKRRKKRIKCTYYISVIQLQFQWMQPIRFAAYLKQDWLVHLKDHNKPSTFPLIFWAFFQCAISKYNRTNTTFKVKSVLTFLMPLSSSPLSYSDCLASQSGGKKKAIWTAGYTFSGHATGLQSFFR